MNRVFNLLKSYNKKINNNDNDDTNKYKSKKVIINYNLIQSYLTAIDNKNKKKIEVLYRLGRNNNNNNNIKNDIVYEMYNENELNYERLQYIIENCTA